MRRSRKGHPRQNGPVAIWLLAPNPESVARSASLVVQAEGCAPTTPETVVPLLAPEDCD
jgi:hypothetical protein